MLLGLYCFKECCSTKDYGYVSLLDSLNDKPYEGYEEIKNYLLSAEPMGGAKAKLWHDPITDRSFTYTSYHTDFVFFNSQIWYYFNNYYLRFPEEIEEILLNHIKRLKAKASK